MEVSEARRLKGLEVENARLKKLLTEAMLDMEALKVVVKGKPFWLQVMTVAQQQPATGLQNLTGRLVMSQLVGLIHPYPIDHLATVLGHDVVQVKDDFRLNSKSSGF